MNIVDLTELSAEEVLDTSVLSLDSYKRSMDFFYWQLVKLNVNIHIIDKVVHFPFGLFVGPERTTFFRFVRDNFFESAVLVITRLITDSGKGHYTLPRFKREVTRAIKPLYKDAFYKHLSGVNFDKRAKSLHFRVKYLRDKYIAHIDVNVAFRTDELADLTLAELTEIRDGINKLFDSLSFNVYHSKLYVDYDPNITRSREHKSDIEEQLDCIARHSALLNSPEEQPETWPYQRERMTENEIKMLNLYRKRFDLPEV
jgi:hypothetical protein